MVARSVISPLVGIGFSHCIAKRMCLMCGRLHLLRSSDLVPSHSGLFFYSCLLVLVCDFTVLKKLLKNSYRQRKLQP